MRLVLLLGMLMLLPIALAQEGATDSLTVIRIERAKADIQEMEELGIGTSFVKDELADAENALLEGDYQEVLEKTESISKRKERALSILDSIKALELRIDDVSKIGDTKEAEEKLSEANIFFKNENYAEAEDAIFEGGRLLRQVEDEYSIVEARYSAARDNTISYVKERWMTLAAAALLILAATVVSYSRILKMRDKKTLENMQLERKVLHDLSKKAQTEYFNEMKISQRIYDIKIRKYRELMLKLDEKIPIYEAKIG